MSLDDVTRGKADKKKRKRSRSGDKKKKKSRSRSKIKTKKKKKSRKSRSRSKKKEKKKKKKSASRSSSSSNKKKKSKKKRAKSSSSDEPPKKKAKKEKKVKKEKEDSDEDNLRKKALASVTPPLGSFSVGDKVVLKNLRSTPKFNGAIGVITDKAEGDRWPVKITEPEKKHFAIKAKNLDKYDPEKHGQKEAEKTTTKPVSFIGEWFVYKKGDMNYYYNSRTKKTTWAKPPGEERPMSEFKVTRT